MDASTVRPNIPTGQSPRTLLLLVILSVCGGGALLGCGGDSTGPAPLDPARAYWALRVNHEAVTLALAAPYDTVQLTATPVNANGDPLPGLSPVTYKATDTSVTVSTSGLVTAHYITKSRRTVKVIASLQDRTQGMTHADTVRIVVTATPDTVATFSMQPAVGDSAKRSRDFGRFPWPVGATDAAHRTLCGATACTLAVRYRSSNPLVAIIDTAGRVTPSDTGHVVLTATALVYGVALRDSVDFRMGFGLDEQTSIQRNYAVPVGFVDFVFSTQPARIILGVGALMHFFNSVYIPYQITFSNPENVDSVTNTFLGSTTGSGNISFNCDSLTNPNCISPNELVRDRRFSVPGIYQMHISLIPSKTYEIDIVRE